MCAKKNKRRDAQRAAKIQNLIVYLKFSQNFEKIKMQIQNDIQTGKFQSSVVLQDEKWHMK